MASMIIELKKFGVTLTSRQAGREASSALKMMLENLSPNETLMIDFSGVDTFSPSWGDEFLTPLVSRYKEKLKLKKTKNPSVKATLEILEETNGTKFEIEK